MITNYSINNYNCAASYNSIIQLLTNVNGVNRVDVNTLANVISVDYNEKVTNSENLINKLSKAGIKVTIEHKLVAQKILVNSKKQINKLIPIIISSLIMCLVIAYLTGTYNWHWPLPSFISPGIASIIELLLCLVVLYLNINIFIQGVVDLTKVKPSSYSLTTLAGIISLLFGIFNTIQIMLGNPSGNLFYLFFAFIMIVFNVLEVFSLRMKIKSVVPLLDLCKHLSTKATVITNHTCNVVPIHEIHGGDLILVKKGERIPVDGIITKGYSLVDESIISNNKIAISKNLNSHVYETSYNRTNDLEIQVVATGSQTMFYKMIKRADNALNTSLVNEETTLNKSFIINWVFIGLSIIAALIWILLGKPVDFALSVLISLLCVASSSSYINSISLTKHATITNAISKQTIINNSALINTASDLDTLMLDKQTIVTEHKPKVVDVMVDQSLTASEFYVIVYNIVKSQNTLEAKAVKEYLKDINIQGINGDEFKQVSAKGITAINTNESKYFAGPLDYISSQGVNITPIEKAIHKMEHEGKASIIVSDSKKILGIITMRDIVRYQDNDAIEYLKDNDINSVLITDESVERTEHIIKQLQIDEYQASLTEESAEVLIAQKQNEGFTVGLVDRNKRLLAQANIAFSISPKLSNKPSDNEVTIINDNIWSIVNAISLLRKASSNLETTNIIFYVSLFIGFFISCGIVPGLLGINPSPIISSFYMLLTALIMLTYGLTVSSFVGENTTPYNILVSIEGLATPEQLEKACEACQIDDSVNVEGILSSSSVLISSTKTINNETIIKRLASVGLKAKTIKR